MKKDNLAKAGTGIAKASLLITVLSIVSKAMGFLRVTAIGWQFGQGVETDAYNSAIKLVAMSMNIVGAALMTVLIPVLSHVKQKHGNRGKLKFFNNVANIVIVLSIILMAVIYAFAPQFLKLMYPDYSPEKIALTIKLTRIGVPIIMALGLMNIVSSYLHSYYIYRPYALMGIPFNLTFFIYLFLMPLSIEGLMYASILAYFTQWLIQAPAVHRTGFRWQPLIDVDDPYIHRTLALIVPTAIGQAVQQINVIVDQNLASGLPDGTVSALENATKINDAIIAIFIVGLTTVIFPLLSEAFDKKDNDRIVELIELGISFIFLITVPATVGVVLLSNDLVKIAFERGAFTAQNTIITAGALTFYSIGLIANGMRHLISKVYYSFKDTKTPMINGMIGVAINIVLNLLLVGPMGHRGLALATAISISIATLWMTYKLKDKIPEIDFKIISVEFIKVGISSLAMGVVVYLSNMSLMKLGLGPVIRLGLVVGLAVVVYTLMVIVVRTQSADMLINTLKKKFGKEK